MDATKPYTPTRRTDGVSLMDVLGGMALLAVLSAIALPNFRDFREQYRLTSAANQVAYEISRARMQAIGQHVSMRLRLVNDGGYVRERSTDGGSTWTQAEPPIPLPSGVQMSTGDGGSPTFNRNGIANAATTINVWNGRGTKRVSTNRLGRVTVSVTGG